MGKYTIITSVKTKEFIKTLDKQRRARIDRIYYLFEEYGRFLPNKYLKKLTSKVWELRPGDVRLFLAIKNNKGIIVHGVRKKTQKAKKQDINLAEKRIREKV